MLNRATLGAGCFWGVEASFARVDGVVSTAVGYCGGTLENPSYEAVCTGRTGHAEVVEVGYDPATVSFESLLEVFFSIHDPTTLDRQGPDIGSQYRSVIFFHSPEQEAAARLALEKLGTSGRFRSPVVTEVVAAAHFARAEEYHQRYLGKRGQSQCRTR